MFFDSEFNRVFDRAEGLPWKQSEIDGFQVYYAEERRYMVRPAPETGVRGVYTVVEASCPSEAVRIALGQKSMER